MFGHYDKLILATGAVPRTLPQVGSKNVHMLPARMMPPCAGPCKQLLRWLLVGLYQFSVSLQSWINVHVVEAAERLLARGKPDIRFFRNSSTPRVKDTYRHDRNEIHQKEAYTA